MVDDTAVWQKLFWFCIVAALAWPLFMEWLRHRPYNLPRQTQHLVMIGTIGFIVFLVCANLAIEKWRAVARADRATHHIPAH